MTLDRHKIHEIYECLAALDSLSQFHSFTKPFAQTSTGISAQKITIDHQLILITEFAHLPFRPVTEKGNLATHAGASINPVCQVAFFYSNHLTLATFIYVFEFLELMYSTLFIILIIVFFFFFNSE